MNPKRLASTMLGIVQEWVTPAFKAVNERFDAIEQRFKEFPPAVKGDKGDDGKDADPELMRQEIRAQLAEWPQPKDGAPGKPADENAIVEAVLARIPAPKDGEPGKDAEAIHPDTLKRIVSEEVRAYVDTLPKPRDGKDAEPVNLEWLKEIVDARAQTALMALPKPKDGEPGRDGKDGEPGRDGKDGVDADPAPLIEVAERAVIRLFTDMGDALVRGLEDDEPLPIPTAPSMNIHVNAGGSAAGPLLRQPGITAREQTVLAKSLADTLEEVLSRPMKPVYGADGRLLYAQRVQKAD